MAELPAGMPLGDRDANIVAAASDVREGGEAAATIAVAEDAVAVLVAAAAVTPFWP